MQSISISCVCCRRVVAICLPAGVGGLSGFVGSVCTALVGVFLANATQPSLRPPSLAFTSFDFDYIAPALGQVFYIGMGVRETEPTIQIFGIPTGATDLYLGFADSTTHTGSAGCYNTFYGGGTVTFELNDGAVPSTSPTPRCARGAYIICVCVELCALCTLSTILVCTRVNLNTLIWATLTRHYAFGASLL